MESLQASGIARLFGPGTNTQDLVNYIREYQIGRGIPKAEAYSVTMYLMAGLLLVGFAANVALKPIQSRS